MNAKEAYLNESLAVWLRSEGYRPSESQQGFGDPGTDMVFEGLNGDWLAVETKVVHAYRSNVFPALVGDVILRSRDLPPRSRVLIACWFESMNERALEDLQRYAERFEPDLNWFVLDALGQCRARLNRKPMTIAMPAFGGNRRHEAAGAVTRGGTFSPGNHRMLKMLLMRGIGKQYWGGPAVCPQ